jgi:hypothetical protein
MMILSNDSLKSDANIEIKSALCILCQSLNGFYIMCDISVLVRCYSVTHGSG